MASNNPTSRPTLDAHGSSCNRKMKVQQSHVGRAHKACVPKGVFRAASKCKITAGDPPKP